VLVSAFSSILMGMYARNPILVAPGMGMNAFFTFSVVQGMNVPWRTALGAVFWSGILFFLLSVFNVRTRIVHAIPRQLRFGVAVGIGLFISLIGLSKAGFIVAKPGTLIGFGSLNAVTLTFIAGMLLTAVLVVRRVRGALILGIVLTTLLAVPIGRLWGDATLAGMDQAVLVRKSRLFAWPDFSVFFELDLAGSLGLSLWPVIFAFLFTDLFDTLSTFIGVAEAADLKDENGEPRNLRPSMIADSLSTLLSGLFGSSPGTSYIESAAGIREGGRTGVTAVVAGLCFLPFMFLSPLAAVVPDIATAPALVMVGVFMMRPVSKIRWNEFDDAFPAFLSLILIPLTYSITLGIVWGFLSWTLLKCASGKIREIPPMLWAIDLFAVLSLALLG
jgi:AGZA family xanthine/uracil permease-like MFS transporter